MTSDNEAHHAQTQKVLHFCFFSLLLGNDD